MVCQKYGKEKVAKVIDSVLCGKSRLKNRTLETLVSLAVDESVLCDDIYIFLRGNPSVLNSVPSPPGSGDNSNQGRERRSKRIEANRWRGLDDDV